MPQKGSISTADGSALVRLGEMTVVCGVKAEISEPDLDLPNSGFIGRTSNFQMSKFLQSAQPVLNLVRPVKRLKYYRNSLIKSF
ncbi:hypothetical protein FRB91_010884 [Serendipita sp. 411]|nr:hypothetical protein FRB91_010884 [Serendipita sp. 411]